MSVAERSGWFYLSERPVSAQFIVTSIGHVSRIRAEERCRPSGKLSHSCDQFRLY
jgi:hypothetical protein